MPLRAMPHRLLHSRVLPSALAFVLALIAVLLSAQAWTGTGRAHGVVAGPDGQPIAGARIALHFETPAGPGPEARSDERGQWSVLGLAEGTWHVAVEAEGFLKAESPAQVSAEGPGPQLRFELRPLAAIAPGAKVTDRGIVLGWIEEGNRHLAAGR